MKITDIEYLNIKRFSWLEIVANFFSSKFYSIVKLYLIPPLYFPIFLNPLTAIIGYIRHDADVTCSATYRQNH